IPVIGEGIVAVADAFGVVHALDLLTGDELWAREMGGWPAQLIIAAGLAFGADASPEAFGADGVEFVGAPAGRIFALDATTGAEVWSTAPKMQLSYLTVHDGVLYVVGEAPQSAPRGSGLVKAMDPASGQELWSHPMQLLF